MQIYLFSLSIVLTRARTRLDQSIEPIKMHDCKLHSILFVYWAGQQHIACSVFTAYMTFPLFMCKMQSIRMALFVLCTYIVPLATVILRLTSTGFGFDLLPYCLNACRTDTAFCWRLHIVPPSSIVDMFVSLPLWKIKKKSFSEIKSFVCCFVVYGVLAPLKTSYSSIKLLSIIHYCYEWN